MQQENTQDAHLKQMKDENNQKPGELKFTKMLEATAGSQAEGKHTLMFDRTGGLIPRFYYYKAKLIDFNKEVLKMKAKNQTVDAAKEVLRQSIVNAAKWGQTIVLDIDMQMPDWKSKSEHDLFDADLIFNLEQLKNGDNCKKILKEDEDVDENEVAGNYYVRDDFEMVFVYKYKNEEHMQQVMNSIPHFQTSWNAFIVTN